MARMSTKSSYDTVSEAASQTATEVSQGDSICSVPAQMISSSSSYGWSKIKQDRAASRFHAYANSRSLTLNGTEPTALQSKDPLGSNEPDAGGFSIRASNLQVEQPLSFHTPDIYHSKELSVVSVLPLFLYTPRLFFCYIDVLMPSNVAMCRRSNHRLFCHLIYISHASYQWLAFFNSFTYIHYRILEKLSMTV